MGETDDSQWFFDGDSAWFDAGSGNGGVNEKCIWPQDQESSVMNVKFHLGAYEADETFGDVRFYNGAGYQVTEFYAGKHISFQNGTIGYEQIKRIANYALNRGR